MIRFYIALLAVAATAANARAQRGCPAGKQWDPSQGSCVEIKRASRRTPEQRYQAALRQIDSGNAAARGVRTLEATCRGGHAASCTLLGFLHRHGRHVTASPAQSLEYFEKGCQRRDPGGCLGGAQLLADGMLGKPDHERAVALLDKACKLDSGRGCFELADKYAKALGTALDRDRAAALYTRARGLLEAGCARSGSDCYALGRIHADGLGTRRSPADALVAFIRGCDGGSGDACREVGAAYREGKGTAADQLKARQFFDRGCLRYDNGDSCNQVVWMMISWEDSARDDEAVRRYAERACSLDKRHCGLRGYIHSHGIGVPKNPRLASQYYLEACESGHPGSCHASAIRSRDGLGVPKSKHRAIELWTKACELSWGPSCQALGQAYKSGDGVAANQPEAYRYFHLACIRRSAEACLDAGRMVEAGTHGKPANASAAITYYRFACDDLDLGAACVVLGDLHLEGSTIKADDARGTELLGRGCSLGEAAACRRLGQYRYSGQHGDTNKIDAAMLFAAACRLGDPSPCWWIDRALADGGAGGVDKLAALTALEDACKGRGHVEACQALGRLYASGGTMTAARPRDARALFDGRCKTGDSRACFQLGWLYATGVGVVKDAAKASAIFRAECDKNTQGACYALGIQLWQAADYKASIALMSKACAERDPAGCTYEAFAHYTAKGARWNVKRAAELWNTACELDYPLACANVGELYWNGIGGERDRKKAFDHYQRGCTPTEATGCTYVGRSYHLGTVVKKDLERAEREYKRMCGDDDWADPEACMFLAELYAETKKGSASEIAALRQQAFDIAREKAEGNPYGHYVLGALYSAGVATIKDAGKALEHFAKACDGYDPLGCARAGELLLTGEGRVAADRTRAVFYLDRACAAGLAGSCARAKEARQPVDNKQPELPARPKKASSCAGCQSGRDGGGALLLVIALALVGLRRR